MIGQQVGSVPGEIRTRDHRIKRTTDADAPERTPTDAGDAGATPETGFPSETPAAPAPGGQQVGSGLPECVRLAVEREINHRAWLAELNARRGDEATAARHRGVVSELNAWLLGRESALCALARIGAGYYTGGDAGGRSAWIDWHNEAYPNERDDLHRLAHEIAAVPERAA